MNKEESNKLKGLSIFLIFCFHLQYDFFGGQLLVPRGEGVGIWFQQIINYVNYDSLAIFGILPSFAYIGVHIFLMLSGYGLTKKYLTGNPLDFKEVKKQILKVLLPYWIALPITHLINYCLQTIIFLLQKGSAVKEIFAIYTPQQYLESFIIPTRWFSERLALNFVGTWWFVGIIVQFYLLFPLLLWLMKKLTPIKFVVVSLLLSIVYRYIVVTQTSYSAVGVKDADILLMINFPARLFEFALGMYLATRKEINFFGKQSLFGIAFIVIGLLSTVYLQGLAISDALIAFGLALTLPRLIQFTSKILDKIWTSLGKYSYSIFLYHEPALKMIIAILFNRF